MSTLQGLVAMKRGASPHVSAFANLRHSPVDIENASSSGSGDGNIPGMGSVVVSISGYSVPEKIKLMKLIDQTGALYTGSLGKGNTHLVCWDFCGAKYALAKKLSLTIVNHKWFEDCLRAEKRLPDGPYVMLSGREVGPLLWEPSVVTEVTGPKKNHSSHDQAATPANYSRPIFIRESPLRMHKNCDERQILAESLTYRNNQENVMTKNDRPSFKTKNKDTERQMAHTKVHAHPLQDDANMVQNGKTYIDKAKNEVPQILTSNQNMDRRGLKKRRLVKISDCGNEKDSVRIGNSGEDKESNSELKNLEIDVKQGQAVSFSNPANEIVDCTTAENVKNSNEAQSRESTSGMDMELGINTEMPLVRKLPASKAASEISCAICWTESSSSRGVLSCGHRFCFKCIRRWAVEKVTKKKKEPTCPLCLKSFDFITVTNRASSNDQKIFSQTLPELSDDNIFMVLGENGIAADIQLTTNLQCNICSSRDTEELLLRCYRCGKRAVHTFCLDPPLPPFPGLQWSCTLCTSGRRPFYELS